MTLIDGKAISEQVKQEIAAEVAEMVAHGEKRPHLAAILVGHDGGSETYVAAKVKAWKYVDSSLPSSVMKVRDRRRTACQST